jgi:diguanylate cyclase (GGDEF)-like protein
MRRDVPIWEAMMRFGLLLLGTTGTLLAANLRLRRRNADLERLAHADPLTGLPNRRHFDRALAAELARSARTGDGLGILLIDVDRFKAINDRHGHAAGDDVLVEVAARLDRAVRGYDTVARWGGDEFAVIAPDVPDADGLVAIAEQVRASVAETPIPVPGAAVEATISVGAIRIVGERFEADEVLGAADRALAGAKAGRRPTRMKPNGSPTTG